MPVFENKDEFSDLSRIYTRVIIYNFESVGHN